MNLKPARLLIALLAVASAPAFAQNLAVVNGKAIPASRLEAVVKQAVASGEKDSPQLREAIKQDIISREVLIQEAEKQGYSKKAEVKDAIENNRQTVYINALVADYVKKNPVADAQVKAEYDRFVAQASKEYRVRHILTATAAEADAVIAKLKAGEKFEELAKQSKDTGTADKGGDLDWMTPGAVPKEFGDAFAGLQKGQVTEKPLQTPNGFHVIKVDDIRDAQLPTLEQAKPEISQELVQQKLQAYREDLVKKAKIQ